MTNMKKKNTSKRINMGERQKTPLLLDIFVNYILKTFFATLLFFIMYKPNYEISKEYIVILKISYIIFYSAISSLVSSVFVSVLYKCFLVLIRKKSYKQIIKTKSLHKWENAIYEMFGSILNALIIVFGFYIFLENMSETFLQFVIFLVITKISTSLVSFIVAKLMYKNVSFALTITMIYTALITIVLFQIVVGGI